MKNKIKFSAVALMLLGTPVLAETSLSLGYTGNNFDFTNSTTTSTGELNGFSLSAENNDLIDQNLFVSGKYTRLTGDMESVDTKGEVWSLGARYDAIHVDNAKAGFGAIYKSTTLTVDDVEGDAETAFSLLARGEYNITSDLSVIGVGLYDIDNEDFNWNLGAEYYLSDRYSIVSGFTMDEDKENGMNVETTSMGIGIKTTF